MKSDHFLADTPHAQGGDKKVAAAIGIDEGRLHRLNFRGQPQDPSVEDIENMRICKRFWVALMLHDIIQEVLPCLFQPCVANATMHACASNTCQDLLLTSAFPCVGT